MHSIINPLQIYSNESWIKYQGNPIIRKGDFGKWDDKYVLSGDVIKQNGSYKMWFTGADRDGKEQIGLAISTNGINWQEYEGNPVLKVGSSLEWDKSLSSQSTVLFDGSKYQMWYSGNSGPVNDEHWSIGKATSVDGITWEKSIDNPVLTASDDGWDNKVVYQPFVLKISNTDYRMWYSGTANGARQPRWQIGYATSSDGINWKKYEGNPVLRVDQIWERDAGDGLGSPSVIFDGEKFHMWYHASGVGYATSTDGKTWVKYENNPVVPRISNGSWDSFFLTDPNVIYDGNKFRMWYSGWSNYSDVSIGLAESSEVILPTPMPTIPEKSPIIILPGMGASLNWSDMSACNTEQSHDWTPINKFKELYYDPLINNLTAQDLELNKDVYFYSYDWRLDPDQLAEKFKDYVDIISTNHPSDTKFTAIGHSLGGIVLKSYIQNYPENKLNKVITAGTPFLGSLMTYPILENGQLDIFEDQLAKTALNYLILKCQIKSLNLKPTNNFKEVRISENKLINTRKETVGKIAPILKTLIPVFDFIKKGNKIVDFKSMNLKNEYLINHPLDLSKWPETHTISGSNRPTLRFFEVSEQSKSDKKKKIWSDGKVIKSEFSNEGDDTVLNISSQIEGADNYTSEAAHQSILTSTDVLNKINEMVGLQSKNELRFFSEDKSKFSSMLVIAPETPLKIRITTMKGETTENNEDFLNLLNPVPGAYKVQISSDNGGQNILYLMLVKNNEEVKSKVYQVKFQANKTRHFILTYTPFVDNPLSLIQL